MAKAAVTFQLDEPLWNELNFAAHDLNTTPGDLVARVMRTYLEQADRAATLEAIRQDEAGELIDHEDVVRCFEETQAKLSHAA